MRNAFVKLVTLVVWFSLGSAVAATWYVDGSVISSGNGKSWATAFKTIQEGIDSAGDIGDTVTVAEGIYLENVSFNGKNIVLRSTDPKDWEVARQTVIDGNQAGAAVTFAGMEDETCVLSGFTIRNGKGGEGGGVCGWTATNSTHATIENNIIAGNSAAHGGGLAHCDGVIRNNSIYGNVANGWRGMGGGVYDCDGVIESNLIVGNSTPEYGGGLSSCDGVIRNDTICYNSSGWTGGGLGVCAATVNCIVWGNTPGTTYECYNLSYCCIQGGAGGEGNIADDPHFRDPDGPDNDPQTYEDNNYRLWVGSLCIDSGKNESWMSGAVDLDGSPRLLQGRVSLTVDMGAYELISSEPTAESWYVDDSVSSSGDGKSWATAFKTIQEAIDTAGDIGDTVTVAEGSYVENVNFNGKLIVLRSTDPKDWEVVKKTVIDGNQAGAAVTFAGMEDETCVLSGFTIRNGKGGEGGGVCGWTATNSTHATIENNIIAGNSAAHGGGLAHCDGVIRNNSIYGNVANGWRGMGGGVYDCDGVIESNLIVGNSTPEYGGGLSSCDGVIRNDTICYNSSGWIGGGLGVCAATVNCIVWGNTPGSTYECYNLSYCCIQGGAGGEGNIADDPHFRDPDGPDNDPQTYEDNNYRLWPGSTCIDSGKNEDWVWKAFDLDGHPRIIPRTSDWTVDMGAYEYGIPKPVAMRSTPEGTLQVIWPNEPGGTYMVWSTLDLLSRQWTEEGTVASEGSLSLWVDPTSAARWKFYRIEIR